MPKDERDWSAEKVRFNEDARTAARHALYFTRLGDPGASSAWTSFLLAEASAHLGSVKDPRLEAGPGGPPASGEFTGVKIGFTDVVERWNEMRALADDAKAGDPFTRLSTLDLSLAEFLKVTVPWRWSLRISYVWIPGAVHLARLHAGLIISILITGAFVTNVEAVSSLYLNNLGVMALSVSLVSAVPILMWMWTRRQRRAGRTPAWDRGGRVHRSLRPFPLEPKPWRTRRPAECRDDGSGFLRKLLEAVKIPYDAILWGRAHALFLLLLLWTVLVLVMSLVWTAPELHVVFTASVITVLLGALIAIGSSLDFLEIHSQPPIRRSILAGLGIYLGVILFFDSPYLGAIAVGTAAAFVIGWAYAIGFRPIVPFYGLLMLLVIVPHLVTYYRRAHEVWPTPTSLAQDDWSVDSLIGADAWPAGQHLPNAPPVVVIAASGGGSRAAIYAAMTLDSLAVDLPEISANLQAIGSVSGGSLTSATYIAGKVLADDACKVPLARRVAGDFLRPVLLGVLPLRSGRGQAIESHWEECPVGLGQIRISALARQWRTRVAVQRETLPPFPLPLMHSASLQRHAVVISPLAKRMYGVRGTDEEARSAANRYVTLEGAGAPTWVFYRSGFYGLEDLLPGFDPKLSEAVRASANFPFGFPLVEISSTRPLYLSPLKEDRDSSRAKTVRLTDGGALSNSGVWSLYHLLMNQSDSLKRRGVLLILVDASAMPVPEAPNRITGLARTILDKSPKGEFLHRALLAGLATEYGECFDAVELDIRPIRTLNVHTTWALDQKSIKKLEDAFAFEWSTNHKRDSLKASFDRLQTCAPGNKSRWGGGSRVPIS